MFYKSLLKPLLFRLDAEEAHDLTAKLAKKTEKSGLLASTVRRLYNFQSSRLSQTFWGHTFRNPVGLAAGFDKNGCLVQAIETLGMGFTEVGSITAQVSCGNPKPRAFRLPKDRALINRMGLNNDGAQTIVRRLQNKEFTFPLGLNIAKTHDPNIMGRDAIDDYLFSYKQAKSVADYITINISCPNTTEGKTFEEPAVLDNLLSALLSHSPKRKTPTLIKFSSDLQPDTLEALINVCESHRIDGYVACNTSSSRMHLQTDATTLKNIGNGGLSGAPIRPKSLHLVRQIRTHVGDRKPIIGVGGIDSFSSALAMLKAGANLLQIYTGLIYEGPSVVKKINRGLANHLRENELKSLSDI